MEKIYSFNFVNIFSSHSLDQWMGVPDLRRILDNLCEIMRAEPSEHLDLIQCMSDLTLIVLRSNSEAGEKFTKTILKKTRGFFSHEKINQPKEWLRRQLYYRFVVEVFKGLNKGQNTPSILAFVNMMKKNVLKDRKQVQLEAVTSEVQELCEKWKQS